MRYHSLGRIPAKRHVQFRDPDSSANGKAPLLVEEVMGFEGFSGNESILYHLFSPCRVKEVGDFERIELEDLSTGPGYKSLPRVLQRARADVDEHGTRAAAVTAVMARAGSYTPPFHIVFDRPFTWAVEHAPSGTLLFVGRVLKPTERSD